MKCFQSQLQEVEPHVLFLIAFGFCQMRDVGILSAGDQTKLHTWPHFLGPSSNLGERRDGCGADGVENTQGDEAGGIDHFSRQPLEGRTGKGVLAKQLIFCLCFRSQHPHTWSSHSCLTPGEEEEEELLMEHVSKTSSAKAQATNLENRSPWLTMATPASAHTSGVTPVTSAGYCPHST